MPTVSRLANRGLVIAVVVFVRGVHALVLAPPHEQFAVTITKAVNDVLFIVVVLELLRTIVSRVEGGGFQLQPFLVIGIISATRDILTVGAELSLVGGQGPTARTDDRTGRQRRRGGRVVGGPGSHTAFRPA
jgi:phosphate-starvation-inducible protein E